ncbi:MAG TPA: hypothetical protein H9733_06210 [Candidatus Anaerotignum merdipullorum]|nr:hypothetical protein [Candidatus Anaerotignum merdipullorum]
MDLDFKTVERYGKLGIAAFHAGKRLLWIGKQLLRRKNGRKKTTHPQKRKRMVSVPSVKQRRRMMKKTKLLGRAAYVVKRRYF